MALPRINAWMSLCPSYVCTTKRLATCLPIPYSSLAALPPNISWSLWKCQSDVDPTGNLYTYILPFTNARSQFCLLIIEIISGAALPSSFRRPTCVAARVPYVASVTASANFFCTNWYLAIGLFLNCRLSRAYVLARAIQSSKAPIVPQAIPYLAELRQLKGPLKPSTSGNMFASGTGHSSSWIMPVVEARRPFLFFKCGVSKVPGGHSFLSMRKPRIFPVLCSFAQTSMTSAIGEFVIHVLAPDKEKYPFFDGCGLAVDSIDPGSDPWLGSVKPKHPRSFPLARSGRYLSFCSCVPNSSIPPITSELCTDMAER